MAAKIRGITIELGADTAKFQSELGAVNKTLNATQKELRDVDRLLKFDPKNTTLLAQKQDLLKSAISDTDEKLKKEKEALEQLKKADKSPEVEKQMRALERQIIADEQKMDKFNDELKETEKASSGVEKAKQKFKAFGKGLGKVGKAVGTTVAVGAATVAAVGKAGAVAGKAIGSLAKDSSEAADQVDKMSQKLGMSRKGYQEWGFVLSQNGADVNSLGAGIKKMSSQINSATSGNQAATDAFAKLGISVSDLNKMSREDVFNATIKGLQGMDDNAERAALANTLLGKSSQQLTPLLNQSADSTEDLKKKANELGMVMSDDAVDAGVKFQDQLDGLKRTFEGVKNGVTSQMLPALTDVMGGLQMLMIGDNGGAEKIEKGFTDLFASIGKILEQAGNIVQPIVAAISKVLPQIVEGLTSALISYLPVLITTAVQLVQAILNAIGSNASAFSSAVVQVVMMLVDLIVKNLPLLLNVGIQAILALATGISQALPDLIPVIISLVITICDMIVQNLPLVIDAGIEIIIGLLEGIVNALPTLLKYIPVLIVKIMVAIGKIIPKLWKFAKQAVKTVFEPFKTIPKWFGSKFAEAVTKIKEKFSGIGNFFAKIRSTIKGKFASVGTTVGNAIGGAFKSAINAVLTTVENAINFIPSKINKFRDTINKIPGVNIGEVPTVKLPRLAKGGITTGATNAIIGEGKYQEAVLPLGDPRTVKLFKEALSGVGTGGTVNQTINVGQMSSYREAYLIKRATEQGLKKMMRATV